jgi:eukaryotic-like serine/threonine-protein kinase
MSLGTSALCYCPTCALREVRAPGSRCPRDHRVMIAVADLEARPTDPFLGRALAGKYEVYGVLGVGGMGIVYAALQAPLDRPVAVKVIRAYEGLDRTLAQQRFFQEARIAARLQSPHTIAIHDFGEDQGDLYMVMELATGRSLRALIAQGPLPVPRAIAIARALLSALEEAHALGLVHRDVKPANVMIDARANEDVVKLLDFGIAKALLPEQLDMHTILTVTGLLHGTPRYMAPEQIRRAPVSAATDVYSVGCVLHEMLTGQPPFAHKQLIDLLEAHARQAPPPLTGPAALLAPIVTRAMEKRAEDRYASAGQMKHALSTLAPRPAPRTRALALAAMVALVWAFAFGIWMKKRANVEPETAPIVNRGLGPGATTTATLAAPRAGPPVRPFVEQRTSPAVEVRVLPRPPAARPQPAPPPPLSAPPPARPLIRAPSTLRPVEPPS